MNLHKRVVNRYTVIDVLLRVWSALRYALRKYIRARAPTRLRTVDESNKPFPQGHDTSEQDLRASSVQLRPPGRTRPRTAATHVHRVRPAVHQVQLRDHSNRPKAVGINLRAHIKNANQRHT